MDDSDKSFMPEEATASSAKRNPSSSRLPLKSDSAAKADRKGVLSKRVTGLKDALPPVRSS